MLVSRREPAMMNSVPWPIKAINATSFNPLRMTTSSNMGGRLDRRGGGSGAAQMQRHLGIEAVQMRNDLDQLVRAAKRVVRHAELIPCVGVHRLQGCGFLQSCSGFFVPVERTQRKTKSIPGA